mmetsp:Transcript_111038/g.265005  ORF Transcript_111038/g.265005 Transcript_111038/m.265005 type:complete len:216 (-) Transcript_111038:1243-1890(-)
MQAAINSVQWMVALSWLRFMAVAARCASPCSMPCFTSAPSRASADKAPLPSTSNSLKSCLKVGIWFGGQSWAMVNAMFLYRTDLQWTDASLLINRSLCASSRLTRLFGTAFFRKALERHWDAEGRLCRSCDSMLFRRSCASADARDAPLAGLGLLFQNLTMSSKFPSNLTLNGISPASSSKNTQPQLKTSASGVISPHHTSGAIVIGVPMGRLPL